MLITRDILVKKYASAFLNVYKEECTPEYIEKLKNFTVFISKNKILQAILSLPSLPYEKKKNIIKLVSEKLSLRPCTKKLILLLLKDKRIELLIDICKKILFLYKRQKDICEFMITTSHNLEQHEQDIVTQFISTQIKKTIATEFTIDSSLINGIRIQSNELLWERSIDKKLKLIEQKLLRREELW